MPNSPAGLWKSAHRLDKNIEHQGTHPLVFLKPASSPFANSGETRSVGGSVDWSEQFWPSPSSLTKKEVESRPMNTPQDSQEVYVICGRKPLWTISERSPNTFPFGIHLFALAWQHRKRPNCSSISLTFRRSHSHRSIANQSERRLSMHRPL